MRTMPSSDGDDTSVRVAVRIRPQNAKEKIDMNQVCTSVEQADNQIYLGKDKAFTFDYVYDMPTEQCDVFTSIAKPLMAGCVDGYNATLLAYGQTGSGKTYTMGTGFDMTTCSSNEAVGIIPRAVSFLFNTIDDRKQEAINAGLPPPEFKVIGQFLELYNEELIDLLEVSADARARCKSRIRIHEDANGGIYITGVSTRVVNSLEDTIKCLKDGALCRSTASTNMNAQSSRSHAIFTLYIRQQRVVQPDKMLEDGKEIDTAADAVDEALPEFETLTAKFHFVDLAGSERLKRTGATGDRAKEGIAINCGLLALGNVISALGDVTKRGCHVPYRDSKLTRLLQDSLGGNSRTIMIACISPSDCDFMETLNTLKYANRARNIKNKVTLNQDKTSKQIAVLRSQIAMLEQELLEYKQGRRIINADGSEGISDLCSENSFLQNENDRLRARIKALQQTMETLQARNAQLLADMELSRSGADGDREAPDDEFTRVVEKYTLQVEELRTKLAEAEAMATVLQRSPLRPQTAPSTGGPALSALAGASMTGSMIAMSTSSMSTSMMSTSSNIMSASFCGPIGGGGALPRVAFGASEFPDTFGDDEEADPYDQRSLLQTAREEVAKQQELLTRQSRKGSGRKRGGAAAQGEEVGGRSLSDEEGDDMEVYDEADVEDEDDEDEDEDEKEKENLQESLANLTNDISLKQRLIFELENKQRQLQAVRDHYERQMSSLMEKIRETEGERDKVLASVSKVENTSEERVRRIKEDFEKKLTNMQSELKRLNNAKREHNKMLRAQQRREQELLILHRDLDEMKRMKVQLLKKVKEEAKRTRQVEMARDREVAQLRKEKRLRETTIRNLELEKKQRDNVLRRKHEEVEMLRKRATYKPPMPRPNSVGSSMERYNSQPSSARSSSATTPVGGQPRFPVRSVRPGGPPSRAPARSLARSADSANTLRAAKVKWDRLERSLVSVVGRRQTVAHFEQDMQNWVQEREKLGRKMDMLNCKLKTCADRQEQQNLTYEVGNIQAQLETAQEQISECQSNIIELEESREEPVTQAMFSRCTLTETRYILERLFEAAVAKGVIAQQAEADAKEMRAALDAKSAEKEQALSMLRIALQQGTSSIPFDVEEVLGSSRSPDSCENDNDPDSLSESEQNGDNSTPVAQDRTASKFTYEQLSAAEAKKKKLKARRLTQTPQELLGVERTPEPLHAADSLDEDASPDGVPDTVLMPPPSTVPNTSSQRKSKKEPSSAGPSPLMRRKQYGSGGGGRPTTLPSGGSNGSNLMTTSLYIPRTSGNDSGAEATPPLTPPPGTSSGFTRAGSLRASNEVNVFSRLTGGSSGRGSPGPTRGVIYAQQAKSSTSRSIFECSHVAEGHTKAVLDLDVVGDHMITGSKDRTAKLWDLNTMTETAIFGAHHNNVSRVRYCPSQHLIFTVCSYYIKLWDDRATDKCIRTLLSSGLSQEGPPEVSQALRQNICPPGETNIMDLVVSSSGDEMFLATANSVKLWDLRRFCAIGKLHGNHQAPVMVLALDRASNGVHRVVTGSKDHYIKVFSVNPGACGLLASSADLQPPHYDGVESLALRGDLLFSGSRDTNIKKWNLANPHQENVINNAHRDWIQSLTLLPVDAAKPARHLLSGCRAGVLKLWRCKDCVCLGDVQAHTSAINAVRTNGKLVFTASNDKAVKFWRFEI